MKHLQTISALSLLLISALPALSAPSVPYFLNLDSISSQALAGSLEKVSFTASMTGAPGQIFFSPWTITNSSDSESYVPGNLYSPVMHVGDSIAIRKEAATGASATVTFTFSSPITNPVFQFNNLDRTSWLFNGINSLTLISGNGDSSDGLSVSGNQVVDKNPGTVNDGTPPGLVGARSAYGSVRVNGTYTLISATLSQVASPGDLFRVQVSSEFAMPEPKIASFNYNPQTWDSELQFQGVPGALYQLRTSPTLDFSTGQIVIPGSVSLGLIDGIGFRSSSDGKAIVQFNMGTPVLGKNFVRVESR